MEPGHALKALLQLQLSSDENAVTHLPHILASLNVECFAPSPNIHLWTTRIASLLNSKSPGSRWAGACIAHKTFTLSKSIMIECGQSWIGMALPMLSKPEPIPTLKAMIRLLSRVFSDAKNVPEFQRQVVTPAIPKFSLALVSIVQSHANIELQTLCLNTLTQIVTSYPAQHKANYSNLSAMSLKFLGGSAPKPIDWTVLEAAARLYTALYLTAGKVGATGMWRQNVEETIAFAWEAFIGLRTTFPETDARQDQHHKLQSSDDPLISIPLKVDRLRCSVVILCHFLRSTTSRTVQVPVGPLSDLATALLSCTTDGQREGHTDPTVRAMELSVMPSLWEIGCMLMDSLARCVGHHLTPHTSKVVSSIAFHLEQNLQHFQRLVLLQTLEVILSNSHPMYDVLLLNRLARAILPSLSIIFTVRSEVTSDSGPLGFVKKKDRKRLRGYEGAELFNLKRDAVCLTTEEGNIVLTALNVTRILLLLPDLPQPTLLLASRVVLSMLCALPQMSPTSLSPDAALHGLISRKAQEVCTAAGLGTSGAMSRSINLVLASVVGGMEPAAGGLQRDLEILLHPRVPPLVRSATGFNLQSLTTANDVQEGAANTVVDASHEEATRGPPVDSVVGVHPGHANPIQDDSMKEPNQLHPVPSDDSSHQSTAKSSTFSRREEVYLPSIVTPRQVLMPEKPIPLPPKMNATVAGDDEDEDEPMPSINVESDSD